MAISEEAKLQQFLQWLQLNKVELRGCKIKSCGSEKGFGLFSKNDVSDEILLVVPLDLAITPMRVLQDPVLGPECRAMLEEGEVDDRFLMLLFLTVECLRKNSSWKPYLDMLPTTFGNPLWFSDNELLELKGTTLHRATELQKKSLQSLYDDKVKGLVKKLQTLYGDLERANSVFWTRALNLPLPRSYVFPQIKKESETCLPINDPSELVNRSDKNNHDGHENENLNTGTMPTSTQGEIVWVEGLVPGIDFSNHGVKAVATWEIDGTGSATGVPLSMYLISGDQSVIQPEKEIFISYGNKGNEELLYLYGFVIDDNPDDYLMIHYPVEALQNVPCSDSKAQLLEAQNVELRCLLPKILLSQGFFPMETSQDGLNNKYKKDRVGNYSWSGERKIPAYYNELVFPDDFLTALRTISMKEDEIFQVSTLLQELVGSEGERQPSDSEVRAAVWEACGDSGALQLLVDLLNVKLMDLEEHSGREDSDTRLLEKAGINELPEQHISSETQNSTTDELMSRNRWSSIVYRRGQKQLTRLFLKEAEHALQLSLSEEN